MGAVFMGALSAYRKRAQFHDLPIATERGIKMPSFFELLLVLRSVAAVLRVLTYVFRRRPCALPASSRAVAARFGFCRAMEGSHRDRLDLEKAARAGEMRDQRPW